MEIKQELFEQYVLTDSKQDFVKSLIPDSYESLYFQVLYALNQKSQLSEEDLNTLSKLTQKYSQNYQGNKSLHHLDFLYILRVLSSTESTSEQKEKAVNDLKRYFQIDDNFQKPQSLQYQSSSQTDTTLLKDDEPRKQKSILDQNEISFEKHLEKSYSSYNDLLQINYEFLHYLDIKRFLEESKKSSNRLEMLKHFVSKSQQQNAIPDILQVYKHIFEENPTPENHFLFIIKSIKLNEFTLPLLQELGNLSTQIRDNLLYQTALMSKLFYNDFCQFKDKSFSQLSVNEKKEKKRQFTKVLEWMKSNLPQKLKYIQNRIVMNIVYINLAIEEYDEVLFQEFLHNPLSDIKFYLPLLRKDIIFQNMDSEDQLSFLFSFTTIDQQSQIKIIETHLSHFFVKAESIKPYDSYLDETFLHKLFYSSKILSGQSEYITKSASIFSEKEINKLVESRQITILDISNKYIKGNDEVKLIVDFKNIQHLTVNIFEIQTESYYSEKKKAFDSNVNLDGLIPSIKTEYHYDDPSNQIVRREFNFEHIQKAKRGIFVIDFIGNSITSRAVFQKGQLAVLNVPTIAGQMIQIIDEENNICKQQGEQKTGIWYKERFHSVNSDGQIMIPYLSEYQNDYETIIVHDGFSQLVDFQVEQEEYNFFCSFLYNQEEFIQGNKAKILIHPQLILHRLAANMKLIKDQLIKVKIVNHQNIPSQLEFREFTFDYANDVEIEIPIQSIIKSIEITVTGEITKMDGTKQKLEENKTIEFEQHSDPSNQIYNVYLKQSATLGYVVYVIDKSGKPIEGIPVNFQFKHQKLKESFNQKEFETDNEGKVVLGQLKDITLIDCSIDEYRNFPETYSTWIVGQQQQNCVPQNLYAKEGEIIEIPLSKAIKLDRKQITIFSFHNIYYENVMFEDLFNHLSINNSTLRISDLKAGSYRLSIEGFQEEITIEVLKGTQWKHNPFYFVQDNSFSSINRSNELFVRIKDIEFKSQTEEESGILVNLNLPENLTENERNRLRVHVYGYNFLSNYHDKQIRDAGLQEGILSSYTQYFNLDLQPTTFQNNKKIADEISYVYNRKNQPKRIGNTLEKPCVLLKRTLNQNTQFKQEELDQGDREAGEQYWDDDCCRGGGGGGGENDGCARKKKKVRVIKKEIDTYLNFLKYPCFVSSNNTIENDGTSFIKGFPYENYSMIQVVVIGQQLAISEHFPTQSAKASIQDLRHESSLKSDKFYTENLSAGKLHENEKLEMSGDSQFACITNIGELFEIQKGIMQTGRNTDIDNKMSYDIWSFVKDWTTLTDSEKLEKYNEYAGHQLNLFVYFKDRNFFNIVVEPFIKNKIQKSFIDHFLLNEVAKMSDYANSEKIQELNILEQSLLVLSLVKNNHKSQAILIAQSIQNAFKILPEDINLQKRLYLTIIESKKQDNPIPATIYNDRNMLIEHMSKLQEEGYSEDRVKRSRKEPSCTANLIQFSHQNQNNENRKSGNNNNNNNSIQNNQERDEYIRLLEQSISLLEQRNEFKQGYKQLEKTIEYKERQYYGFSQIDVNFVTVNKFWVDLVNYIIENDGIQGFVSENFVYAFNNHVEALAVIALTSLSFSSNNVYDIKSLPGRKISLSAIKNMIYFSKEIIQSEELSKSNINIVQTFFDPFDLYTTMKDDPTITIEKTVDEFLVNKIYGSKVIISNISITNYNISILTEIPQGAIPVNSFEYTKSIDTKISSYQTTNDIQFFFYFPQPGTYSIYRSNASKNGVVISQAHPIPPFVVKLKPEIQKMESFQDILNNGSKEDILKFARSQNLRDSKVFKIEKVLYYAQTDKNFFLELMQILKEQKLFNRKVWEQSLTHNYVQGVNELLANTEFRQEKMNQTYHNIQYHCSHSLKFDNFNVFEYHPLLTSRVHSFMNQNKSKTLNVQFKQTYAEYLNYLARIPHPDENHQIVLSYYLILQERIDEAIQVFSRIKNEEVSQKCKIQYDYFAAYLDIYTGGPNFQRAREICERYIEYPIISWRNLFVNLQNQLSEYDGEVYEDSNQIENADLSKNAEKEEFVILEAQDKQLVVNYQNASKAEVNLYLVDIEVLFSAQPFMEGNERSEFTYTKPNETIKLVFEKTVSIEKLNLNIPEKYANKNLYLQLVSSSNIQNLRYFSSSLKVQMIESYGQVKVQDESNNPLQKVYVKCFSKNKDNSVTFYRDGYTDLRGRFEYALSSERDVNDVQEFSVLICSEDHGSIIKKAKPPTAAGRMDITIQLLSKKK